MQSVKQGGIKYHFLSLWYDSTWDWTQVSQSIGEHSNQYTNVRAFLVNTCIKDDLPEYWPMESKFTWILLLWIFKEKRVLKKRENFWKPSSATEISLEA